MIDGTALDHLLQRSLDNDQVPHPLPRVAAVVASRDKVEWSGAAGYQIYHDLESKRPPEGEVTVQSPFALFSQAKLVTCICGLQLLEQGLVQLDDHVERWVPELRNMQILKGFTEDDQEIFEEPTSKVTFLDLFLHSGGFAYTLAHPLLERYRKKHGLEKQVEGLKGERSAITGIPFRVNPGSEIHYGVGIDYIGYVVEAISGMDLEDYCKKNIFEPLGISDMVWRRDDAYLAKQVNLVMPAPSQGKDGSTTTFVPTPFTLPIRPISCGGGGSMNASPASFIKILQALLNDGVYAPNDYALFKDRNTVEMLFTDQVRTRRPNLEKSMEDWLANDQDPWSQKDSSEHAHARRGFAMGNGLLLDDIPGVRRAGTMYGAGFGDTYYWVDRKAGLCATFMINTPSRTPGILEFWKAFEQEIYRTTTQ